MDNNQFFENIKPIAEALIKQVESHPNRAIFTGFILCKEPPGLMHITSVENVGDDLIRLHIVLSSLCAELEEEKPTERKCDFSKFQRTELKAKSPMEIADKLAEPVILYGGDENQQSELMGMAQEYLISRRPKAVTNGA